MAFQATTDNLSKLTIASQEQIEGLNREIDRSRAALRAYQSGAFSDAASGNTAPSYVNGETVGNVDVEEVSRSLKTDEDCLAKNSPPDLSPSDKNGVYQYYKAASKEFAEGLLSHGQMRDASAANLQQYQEHQRRYGRMSVALRNAIRILDPSEPFGVESMRPIQPNYRNMAAWYDQFDQIAWGDQQEVEQLERNLDDDLFMRFMVLVSKGVDSSVIRTKLGMGMSLFQACQQRLARDAHYLENEMGGGDESLQHIAFDQSIQAQAPPPAPKPLTELEAMAVADHMAAAGDLLFPTGAFSIADARQALDIPDKEARALLRGLVKEGVVRFDAQHKTYRAIEARTE